MCCLSPLLSLICTTCALAREDQAPLVVSVSSRCKHQCWDSQTIIRSIGTNSWDTRNADKQNYNLIMNDISHFHNRTQNMMTREPGLDWRDKLQTMADVYCRLSCFGWVASYVIHLVRAVIRINNVNIDLSSTINRIIYCYCSSVGHQGGLAGVIISIINLREILHCSSGKKMFQLWQPGWLDPNLENWSDGWRLVVLSNVSSLCKQ